jgi:hypothetical protein
MVAVDKTDYQTTSEHHEQMMSIRQAVLIASRPAMLRALQSGAITPVRRKKRLFVKRDDVLTLKQAMNGDVITDD